MEQLRFNPSAGPTVGVELELQLLEPGTCAFSNTAPSILKSISDEFKGLIKEEFIKCMVEINTGCCNDIAEAEADLRRSLAHLHDVASLYGTLVYAGALHPTAKGTGENLTDNIRYERILDELQIVGRRFITQGMHVHVGVDDPEKAIRTVNAMRMYLPLLLALTASSAFYRGEDTGLHSYRTVLFGDLPQTGLPDHIEDWDDFVATASLLIEGRVIGSVRDLWWDVRPHPDFGTVEVRICDQPTRFQDVLAVAALVQSLVSTISKEHMGPHEARMQILRANKWQAIRHGLGGVFVNPVTARRSPMREAVVSLMDMVRPEAERLGNARYLEGISRILARGTGADRQRELFAMKPDFRHMSTTLAGEFFLEDLPPGGPL